jgi:hypothetical protein
MIITGRVNITLNKATNYLILGDWSDKISYKLSDAGIPVVKVPDSTKPGYSVYSLKVKESTVGASPLGAGSSEWERATNEEFIYMQQAYIERLQAAIVTAESIQALTITTGKLTVTDGAKIGVFVINNSNNLLATSGTDEDPGDDSMLLSASLIRFLGKYSSVFIGADTYPGTGGGSVLATHRIEVNRNIDDPFPHGNVGHYFSVEGEKALDDDGSQYSGNHALYIAKGDIAGVRFRTRRVSGTRNLSAMDTNVIVTANNAVIWLPNNPEDGQMYWINPNGFSATIRSTQNIWDNSGNIGTSHSISGRVWNFYLYDRTNSRWLKSWMNA